MLPIFMSSFYGWCDTRIARSIYTLRGDSCVRTVWALQNGGNADEAARGPLARTADRERRNDMSMQKRRPRYPDVRGHDYVTGCAWVSGRVTGNGDSSIATEVEEMASGPVARWRSNLADRMEQVLDGVQETFRDTVDWASRHPGLVLGSGLVVGIALGGVLARTVADRLFNRFLSW